MLCFSILRFLCDFMLYFLGETLDRTDVEYVHEATVLR